MFRWLFRTSPWQADLGLLVVRSFFGLALALGHGLGKVSNFERFISKVDALGLPAPQVLGTLAGLSEFLGGLLLVVGFLTRGAAATVAVTMGVAAFFVHGLDPFVCKGGPCQEFALCYGATALAIFLAGPGRLSVDYLLFGRQPARKPPGAHDASGSGSHDADDPGADPRSESPSPGAPALDAPSDDAGISEDPSRPSRPEGH